MTTPHANEDTVTTQFQAVGARPATWRRLDLYKGSALAVVLGLVGLVLSLTVRLAGREVSEEWPIGFAVVTGGALLALILACNRRSHQNAVDDAVTRIMSRLTAAEWRRQQENEDLRTILRTEVAEQLAATNASILAAFEAAVRTVDDRQLADDAADAAIAHFRASRSGATRSARGKATVASVTPLHSAQSHA